MQEARASWNTIYLDPSGFECQVTLRDEEENLLVERVAAVTQTILAAGGYPVVRRVQGGPPAGPSRDSEPSQEPLPEKTYLDDRGLRRCNLNLTGGRFCGQPVTEKEGRYGLFWSCPDYRNHAPRAD